MAVASRCTTARAAAVPAIGRYRPVGVALGHQPLHQRCRIRHLGPNNPPAQGPDLVGEMHVGGEPVRQLIRKGHLPRSTGLSGPVRIATPSRPSPPTRPPRRAAPALRAGEDRTHQRLAISLSNTLPLEMTVIQYLIGNPFPLSHSESPWATNCGGHGDLNSGDRA